MEHYKPRLIVKSYMQKEDINYNNIFALITKMASICILLILDIVEILKVHQMDVKITFLNRDLKKEIYVDQLKGYILEDEE